MPWLLLACASEPAPGSGAPMDRPPAHTVTAGGWSARVADGVLTVEGGGATRELSRAALPELALLGDTLAFPEGTTGDTDLVLVDLSDGARETLTTWAGAEDRPSFSPDGARLVFFSGRSGLPALYTLDLVTRIPVQVTNVGIDAAAHRPGEAPEGFVPPPDDGRVAWEGHTVTWTARGAPVRVAIP